MGGTDSSAKDGVGSGTPREKSVRSRMVESHVDILGR